MGTRSSYVSPADGGWRMEDGGRRRMTGYRRDDEPRRRETTESNMTALIFTEPRNHVTLHHIMSRYCGGVRGGMCAVYYT